MRIEQYVVAALMLYATACRPRGRFLVRCRFESMMRLNPDSLTARTSCHLTPSAVIGRDAQQPLQLVSDLLHDGLVRGLRRDVDDCLVIFVQLDC